MPLDALDVGVYPWPLAEPLWRHGVQSHLNLITPPAVEPITLADAKLHLRVTQSAEDAYITRLIVVARRQCESYTRRSLCPQTWQLVMDRFPRNRAGSGLSGLHVGLGSSAVIRLERPPIASVGPITYIDTEGTTQSLDESPAFYQTDLPSGPQAGYGRVRPVPDNVWPDTQRRRLDAASVKYHAGYPLGGSPATPTVPEDLVAGMLLIIGELYKTRTESVHVGNNPALIRARSLWSTYRVY